MRKLVIIILLIILIGCGSISKLYRVTTYTPQKSVNSISMRYGIPITDYSTWESSVLPIGSSDTVRSYVYYYSTRKKSYIMTVNKFSSRDYYNLEFREE